jgi:Flp pilus assembly pilin Flp
MTADIPMLSRFVRRLREDDRGAGLIEYCFLVALIAIVCVGAVAFFGRGSGGSVDNSRSCIEAAYENLPKPDTCP